MILQELLRLQDRHGYLPRRQLLALAERLAVPLFRIHEVATFYPHFRLFRSDEEEQLEASRLPEYEVHVCRDPSCQLRGAAGYLQGLCDALHDEGTRVAVRGVSCLGRCDRAPAVRIHRRHSASDATAPQAEAEHDVTALLGRPLAETIAAVRNLVGGTSEKVPHDADRTYRVPHPPEQWRIDVYRDKPRTARYAAVRQFVASGRTATDREQQGNQIIQSLETAQLLGMGGAGGRAFKKWSEVRAAVGERKYVICNADESEPGTFKDRELLLHAAHLVVEGVLLGALVLGAERAYIYVRHEYEEAIDAVREEIAWARQQGLCGSDLLGSGLKCEVELFVSPGGYICGEQTALVQAIQDERAEPRNRPPELQTNGLWNMPTLLNNVETLAWVPSILTQSDGSGRWYAELGAEGFKGARFFSISGDIERPGVYEVPVGIRLGQLLDLAGGMRSGCAMKAVALSGPSGGFLPASLPLESFSTRVRDKVKNWLSPDATAFDIRQLPLDINVARELGLMLGAAIIVFGEATDLVEQTLSCLRFFRAESCGKCVPCRIGSTKLVELCEDLQAGQLTHEDVARLNDRSQSEIFALAQTLTDTAICSLGTSVPKSIQSLLAYFPDDVDRCCQRGAAGGAG